MVKCNEDEQEGPSCHFDLETDTVEIDPKEQAGWSSNVTRKEVGKDLYLLAAIFNVFTPVR